MKINVLLLVILAATSGCVSMSTLQTARTLEEGHTRQSFGGGTYKSKSKDDTGLEIETNLPYVEYSYRMGLVKDVDLGLKVTLIGSYAADAKYQFYSDEKFAASTGFGLGYMSYKITSGSTEKEVKYIDAMLPLYLSYDFAKSFSLYMSPKFIYRSASGDATGSDQIKGLGIGAKIGDQSGVFVEAAVMKGKDSAEVMQYNLSYFW